ncbi:protein NDRG3-like isoform X2 [Apostichopus japonicus]
MSYQKLVVDEVSGTPLQEMTKPTHEKLDETEQPLLSSSEAPAYQVDFVSTEWGNVLVAVQGEKTKPAIVTFHDIGLNHVTCFQSFFNYADMQPILKHFCVYHINAIGQEQGAPQLPDGFQYPTMDQLADVVLAVLKHFRISSVVGFGMGAGANILARFHLVHPEMVDGLVLINCVSTQSTWSEWAQQKLSSYYLRGKGMTNYSQEYLLWHYFGKKTMETHQDLVVQFRENLAKSVNAFNLSLFIDAYIKRTDLNLRRELDRTRRVTSPSFDCDSLLVAGANSPHLNDTVEMNSRLNPQKATWIKLSDCGGMILEEQPGKLTEAFRLFLQGLGYVLKLRPSAPAHSVEPPAPRPRQTGQPSPVMV